jgi:ectoine hydroxylase-related dioxygenase (phytanoyl-CoA dioxygenase family)
MRDLPAHRDTWGSNIHAQINWWAPIWPVKSDRTIGIFPALWDVPVANTSAEWDYREFMQQIKADKNTGHPMLPQCAEPPPASEAVPIIIDPGDIMAFSGAHLHCSIPNQSGVARISTETRTVSAHDLLHTRAAKNVDCKALDSQFDWFRNIETGDPLTRYVLAPENKLSDSTDPTP